MSKLPESWSETTLGEAFILKYGKNLPVKEFTQTGYPVFGANGQIGFYSKYHYENSKVLITCRGATCGTINRNLPKSFITNNSIVIDIINDDIDESFLEYAIKATDRANVITGTAQPQITIENLSKHKIKIAPINEQKRIVAKLEKLLAKVETSQKRLDKIPLILKRFRQSVLMQACSGELTKEWRGNNQAEEWQETTLEQVIIDKPRNGYSPKGVNYETSVKNLTLTATTSGKFKPECFKYIDESIDKNSYLWLEDGDILIQRSNSIDYVGVSAIYRGKSQEYIYPDLMMKVRANDKAITEYLHLALSDEKVRTYFRMNATGTAGNMPKINQGTVMNAPISLPSIEEQKEIIRRVEEFYKIVDRIEARYQKARTYTDRLTQSILAKAFRGELVSQDPDDEPASVLLERIREEKTKITLNASKNKKKERVNA